MDLLVFSLDSQPFGLPARDVDRVVRSVAITELPGAPSVIEGVIDVRGGIVPVFDLRRRFDLRSRPAALNELMIIATLGERRIAFRVDEGASVQRVDENVVETATDSLAQSRHVAGLARLPDGIVVIQDLARFLSEAESDSLARALAEQEPLPVA